MIEVAYSGIIDAESDDGDHVGDNLLDAARELAREILPMTLEDPGGGERNSPPKAILDDKS